MEWRVDSSGFVNGGPLFGKLMTCFVFTLKNKLVSLSRIKVIYSELSLKDGHHGFPIAFDLKQSTVYSTKDWKV